MMYPGLSFRTVVGACPGGVPGGDVLFSWVLPRDTQVLTGKGPRVLVVGRVRSSAFRL